MQADSEARLALLRKRAKKGKSKEEDQAEKALERQLLNKGRPEASDEKDLVENAEVARPGNDANVTIMSADGHCELIQEVLSLILFCNLTLCCLQSTSLQI